MRVLVLEDKIEVIKEEGCYFIQDTTTSIDPPEFILLGNLVQANKYLIANYPGKLIN